MLEKNQFINLLIAECYILQQYFTIVIIIWMKLNLIIKNSKINSHIIIHSFLICFKSKCQLNVWICALIWIFFFDSMVFHFSFHFIIKYLLLRVAFIASHHTLYPICMYVQMIFMNYSLWISVTQREQRSHCIFFKFNGSSFFFCLEKKNYKFVVAPCVLKMMRIIIKWTIVCV